MSYVDARFPVALAGTTQVSFGGYHYEQADGSDTFVATTQLPVRFFTVDAQALGADRVADVRDFYLGVDGPENTFRFRDPWDWSTSWRHRVVPGVDSDPSNLLTYRSREAHVAGVGDGVSTTFQLQKWYWYGGYTRSRPIDKLPASSEEDYHLQIYTREAVGDPCGVPSYTVDRSTGQVTFASAPAAGTEILWAGTFDVHARFDPSVTESFLTEIIRRGASGGASGIKLMEVQSTVPHGEPFNPGGVGSIASAIDLQLSWGDGSLQEINMTTSGKTVYLPDFDNAPLGGPQLFIYNSGSNTFTLRGFYGNTVVTSVTPGLTVELNKTSDGLWMAF